MSWGQLCTDPSLFSTKLRMDMIYEKKKKINELIPPQHILREYHYNLSYESQFDAK